jgi:hypothetical protein
LTSIACMIFNCIIFIWFGRAVRNEGRWRHCKHCSGEASIPCVLPERHCTWNLLNIFIAVRSSFLATRISQIKNLRRPQKNMPSWTTRTPPPPKPIQRSRNVASRFLLTACVKWSCWEGIRGFPTFPNPVPTPNTVCKQTLPTICSVSQISPSWPPYRLWEVENCIQLYSVDEIIWPES